MILGTILAATVILTNGPLTSHVETTARFDRIADCLLWADTTIRHLYGRDLSVTGAYCTATEDRQ